MNLGQVVAVNTDDEAGEFPRSGGFHYLHAPRQLARTPWFGESVLAFEVDRGLGFRPWPTGRDPSQRAARLRSDSWTHTVLIVLAAAPLPLALAEVDDLVSSTLLKGPEKRARVKTALSNLVEMGLAGCGDGQGRRYWITLEGRREV